MICVYLLSFPAHRESRSKAGLTNFCTWHKRNVLLGQKLPGIRLLASSHLLPLLLKVSWHGIQRKFAAALLLQDSQTAIAPAGSPALSSAHFLSFRTSLISLPDGASKKLYLLLTLISLKCTLKKKTKPLNQKYI